MKDIFEPSFIIDVKHRFLERGGEFVFYDATLPHGFCKELVCML